MRLGWLTVFVWLGFVILSIGCKTSKQGPESLPRPAAGYLHWLQKDSMLTQSHGLIAEVSQSGRAWLQGSEPGRADVMLKAAPNWFYASSSAGQLSFSHLASIVGSLPGLGIEGLYMGDLGERPALLATGHDLPSASLAFDSGYGSEAEYEELAQRAEAAGMQTGSQLLGAATSQGADFLLQARNSPGYAGLYAMLPLPINVDLPLARDEWDCQILPEKYFELLREDVPATLARDSFGWVSKGGWAVTGAVTGSDGKPRRWIYRYSEDASKPVLAWQDPSGLAARLLSAGIIKLTGLLGQSLTGLSLEPLFGLEPAGASAPGLSPGMDAMNELARQIHRYGGWALQADSVPDTVMEAVLAGPCDFCRDDLTVSLVAFGLAAADGRPVAQLYRTWAARGLEVGRLARGMYGQNLPLRILQASEQYKHVYDKLESVAPGRSLTEVFAMLAKTPQDVANLRRFELAWRLGMPGLFFWEGQDAAPLANDSWLVNSLRTRKKYNLAAGRVISVTRGNGGGMGLLSALPDGGYWLLACNFGIHKDQLVITLDVAPGSATDAATGESLDAGLNSKVFSMPLDGRIARNVLLK